MEERRTPLSLSLLLSLSLHPFLFTIQSLFQGPTKVILTSNMKHQTYIHMPKKMTFWHVSKFDSKDKQMNPSIYRYIFKSAHMTTCVLAFFPRIKSCCSFSRESTHISQSHHNRIAHTHTHIMRHSISKNRRKTMKIGGRTSDAALRDLFPRPYSFLLVVVIVAVGGGR